MSVPEKDTHPVTGRLVAAGLWVAGKVLGLLERIVR